MANKPTDDRDKAREKYRGGLGDKPMQHAWMQYADANEVSHDHEDEEPFKYGFDAGHEHGKRSRDGEVAELKDFIRSLNLIVFEEWYGKYQDGKFCIFDGEGNGVASGKDALEAWAALSGNGGKEDAK